MIMVGSSKQVVLFLALVVTFGFVSSFRISHRSERNTDLAEALEILQRQRRRVGVEDFLNQERLLEGRPLTLDDVNDWLRRSNGNDVINDDDWMSNDRNFKDFNPSDAGYDMPPVPLGPARIKASDDEVNDIFAADDGENNSEDVPEKKKKEEVATLQGDKQAIAQTADLVQEKDPHDALNSLTDEEVRVLMKAVGKLQQRADEMSKTKKSDELSQITSDIAESTGLDVSPDSKAVLASEPVSQEELKSVFTESKGPFTKETKIIASKQPGQDIPQILEQEILSEKFPDDTILVRERELTNTLPQAIENELEAEQEDQRYDVSESDEAAVAEAAAVQEEEEEQEQLMAAEEEAAAEEQANEDAVAEEIANMDKDSLSPELVSKYLLMNKDKLYLPQQRQNIKRTAKRASGIYASDDMKSDVNEVMNTDGGSLNLSQLDSNTLIQAFVAKILALQNQIDDLKFKNRLEDLENDELTDALNEATMGQREGSVSSDEWKSLQHAIEIEQALQDLKTRDSPIEAGVAGSALDDDAENERKRGEPWKRADDLGDDEEAQSIYGGAIASRSPDTEQGISSDDIERWLSSAYQVKNNDDDADEDEENQGMSELEEEGGNEVESIASLFLSNADRCPAIQLYSNNCEMADLYNLPVDFEARALCNLHEMCYACGYSLSVSQPQCDLVYRAAVTSLCHKKNVCVAESEIFLRSMKLKTRYIPHVQPSCRSRCTAQFMGMF